MTHFIAAIMTDIRRLGELHIIAARTSALRIHAFSNAVIPGEWTNVSTELITMELLDFAFHARRINEICDIDCKTLQSVNALPIVITENNPGLWVERYDWALNSLIHAREFAFGYTHAEHRKLFVNAESNIMPTYVQVKTDQRETKTVSIFGVSQCFLAEVIPIVKSKFPTWQF